MALNEREIISKILDSGGEICQTCYGEIDRPVDREYLEYLERARMEFASDYPHGLWVNLSDIFKAFQ